MDRFVTSLFEKIFLPPPGAQPRQFFSGDETPEVRGLRAERMINRDETPPEGDPDVPEEPPLDTREFINLTKSPY
jgi:hypothetical protein